MKAQGRACIPTEVHIEAAKDTDLVFFVKRNFG
jgi:hypothetical protein